jgi:hypothetical protein
MRLKLHWQRNLSGNRKAVSPAIATVIITCSTIVMVMVAMVYSQNYLTGSIAKNEFATNKQFMLTTGLQIDDIAWTIGRTQTVRYSCRYSQVQFEPQTVCYSIEVNDGTGWTTINSTLETGAIMFNMPVSSYSLGNNYFEPIFPSELSFLQSGPSAAVSQVYVIEKLPMNGGSFARVVAVPSIRMLNSTIGTHSYVKFFLPLLTGGPNPRLSQSVTLIGKSVTQYIHDGVVQVRFRVTFPKAADGFDSSFFPFGEDFKFGSYYEQIAVLAPNSVVEFYVGEVSVSLGAYM